ncbi:MAG: DUF1565 domain-containing protein [Nitrososphaera sp.]|nr:DUF1565 domain-containing protein [Nitrososphaera sp.]
MNARIFQRNLKSATAILFSLLLMGTSANALAASTYYVDINNSQGSDSNPGTQSQPWKTIGKAANAMGAGDTAIVLAGTYNEKVSTVRSGSSGNRITFRAMPGARVLTFLNVSHNYITIDGFEMTGANAGTMMNVTGDYFELLNNVIHDMGASWGVVNLNGSADNAVIRGNRFYSSAGPGDDLPYIIIQGNNHLVENNEIGPAKDADAFRAWGNGHIIRGNYIHDFVLTGGSASHMDIIQTFGSGIGSLIFEKNLIDMSNVSGGYPQMFMTENNGNSTTGSWEIRNNIWIGVPAVANIGIPNLHFYNNTVYDSGSSLVIWMYNVSGKGDHTGAKVKNNIIVAPSNISSYSAAIARDGSYSGVEIDNNFITRIGTWGAVSGFNETNGLNGGNPQFVSASANNFHVQANSPAINRGATLAGFNYDYDGVTRPQGSAWDIGTFENGGSSSTTMSAPKNLRLVP